MDKLTYEQRIDDMAKIHADRYNEGGRMEYAGGPLRRNEPEHMKDEAEVTIAAQAEAIREALKEYGAGGRYIDTLLIEHGYVPEPEVKMIHKHPADKDGSGI